MKVEFKNREENTKKKKEEGYILLSCHLSNEIE